MNDVLEFTPSEAAEAWLAMPYTFHLGWSAMDDCYLVTVEKIPDFFAAGLTPAEARTNARDALASHVDGYRTTGTPIPAPKQIYFVRTLTLAA